MFNLNSGYGMLATHIMASTLSGGQVFVVCKNAAAQVDLLKQMFRPDDLGRVRFAATIDGAMDLVVANRGDLVLVAPGHTETVTTAITLDVAGVKVLGLGWGSLRPTITVNGAIDGVNINAANVWFDNFNFAAPETDEQTSVININGVAGCTVRNIRALGSKTSKNVVDMITVVAASDDLLIENIEFYNTVVAVNSFISLEGASSRVTLRNIVCHGDVATAGLIDGALITQLFMEDVRIAVVGSSKPAATLDSNPTGLARNCFFSGTSTTLATNANLGNALRVDNIKVLEETDNSKSAAIIPAVDVD
jgi:hypothetical protein